MGLSEQSERQAIAEALAGGRLSVPDEHGFHHWVHAVCPEDGQRVPPQRTIMARDARGRHIDALVFRCASCGRTWQTPAAADELHLT